MEVTEFIRVKTKTRLQPIKITKAILWCPLAEDFRTRIIENATQGVNFWFKTLTTTKELSNWNRQLIFYLFLIWFKNWWGIKNVPCEDTPSPETFPSFEGCFLVPIP